VGNESTVQVEGPSGPVTIPRDRIYFAFGDGRFSYDCVSCRAACCRGHGYSLLCGELAGQLAMRPALRAFIQRDRGGRGELLAHYVVANYAPSCFFLDGRSMCSVQVEHGYDAKPETCRFFPFNNFRLAGDYLVVSPHHRLCPLTVVSPPGHSICSSHGQLFREMASAGLGTGVRRLEVAATQNPSLIAVERSVLARSERCLRSATYEEFACAQLVETREQGLADTAPPDAAIRIFCDTFAQALGAEAGPSYGRCPELVSVVVASTAALRSQLAFPSGVRRRALPGLPPARIPFFLLGLHKVAALALEAGMQVPTYQTLQRIFESHHALLWVLAFADVEMVWHPGAGVDVSGACGAAEVERFIRVGRELLPAVQRRRRARLGDIVCRHIHEAGAERTGALMRLATWLAGRLVPASDVDRVRVDRRAIRRALQRWALGTSSERIVRVLAAR